MVTKEENIKRVVAFIFGLIECLLLAGCTYGWAAIVFVFKEDGVFSHLCESSALDNSTNVTLTVRIVTNQNSTPDTLPQQHRYPMCQEQDNRLNLAFTIANFALEGSTLFVGWLFDSYGLRISRLVALSLFVTGSLMMGFASVDIPVLIFPGLICFGVGGIMFLVTNLQIGNYFDRFQLTVVTIYNSAFDTSSVTLLIFKVLYENGVQRLYSFIFLASFATVVVLTSTFVLIPKFKITPRRQQREEKSVVYKNKSDEMDVGNGKQDNALIEDKGKVVLEERKFVKPLRHYVFTRFYLIHLMWHAFIQLRFFVYIGSLNVWLQIVTKDDLTMVSALTNVFSIVLMCGIIAGPLEGFILMMETRRLKRDNMTYFDQIRPAAVPQMLCTIFCLILSILVLVPMVELLYVQFIMLTICRAFLYGLNCAFLVMAFPPEHFGKLFGILMTFNGALAALQYPLFIWSSGPPRDPTPVNILLLVLTVITLLQPIQLWIGDKFQCCRKVPAEDVKLDNEIEG